MQTGLISTTKANILLVDDSVENLRVLSALLTKHGYDVRCARSGALALTSLQSVKTDLILLDIRMPLLDGYQVCKMLKENPNTCQIPVIFISALDETVDKVKAFNMGGEDYITKPFEIPEVLARVEHQLTISLLQQTLQRQSSELVTLNRGIERLTATMTHHVQAPLQRFTDYLDILEREVPQPVSPQVGHCFSQLQQTSQTMQALVDGWLYYAKIEPSTSGLVPVDCEPIFRQALADQTQTIQETQARIKSSPLPRVLGDASQLLQLFSHLLSNALKFCPPGDRPEVNITVQGLTGEDGVQAAPSMVQINIQDHGIGLDPENYDLVFEEFTRLEAAKSFAGHGIGLAICQKIVDCHGGKIWIESIPQGGTCLSFTLQAVGSP